MYVNTETIGLISGLLTVVSVIPYSIRTYQRKIHPNLTSWSLWTIIGLALLLTYKSSGAKANIWPAIFGFTNPLLVLIIMVRQKNGQWERVSKTEIACIVLCFLSLGIYLVVHESRELVQYALYIAIIADACAAIPTIVYVWKTPEGERPFAWSLFAVAYGMAIFAITEHTFANYALPVYMFAGGMFITIPLVLHRWRRKAPLSEWI